MIVVRLRAPRRHAAESYAVVNDEVELAVGKRLRGFLPHIRRLRIQVVSHFGVAATIIAVTNSAVVGKVMTRFDHQLRSKRHGIPQTLGRRRNGHHAHVSRNYGFDLSRLLPSTESTCGLDPPKATPGDNQGYQSDNKDVPDHRLLFRSFHE